MSEPVYPARRRARRVLIWSAVASLLAVAALMIATTTLVPISSDALRDRLVAFLSDRLDADVELGALSLRIWPSLHIDGSALVIRPKGQADAPPVIEVRNFAVDSHVLGLWHKHVAKVHVDGLTITIVPRPDTDLRRPDQSPAAVATAGNDAPSGPRTGFILDQLESVDARLVIVPDERGKPPRVWAIHRLRMRNVGVNQSMPFEATLTNAVPPGEIQTAGAFGPWRADDPGQTPLHGTFDFERADLSVFHGISGTLTAKGTFGRTLDHIDVNGETDTPDFTVHVSGHPFPLKARYHAVVDGTNGDTVLERIDAQFLESSLVAKGRVVDAPGPGRTVALDITMDRARLEDVMRMVVKAARPPVTGLLKLHSAFLLPPGETDVIERLRLNGTFFMSNARFTNVDVQGKINELSHRGRGIGEDQKTAGVVSNFEGKFKLAGGRIELPTFTFSVPGAAVKLAGVYSIRSETVNFAGDLLLAAKVSQTQSGIKRFLLKAIDPLFNRKGGGSSLPIKITGKRDDPSVGLDMHRIFHRGP